MFLSQMDVELECYYWGNKPIHLACKKGHIEVLKILIANKCGINLIDGGGYQPIHLALENNHNDVVKILIENKCDINASDKSGNKPIHLASKNGNIDIVKILIENKCDINVSDKFGYQPIHFACKNGLIGIVKILIEYKCDINASDKSVNRPVHLACVNGHIDILKMLIENKCDINASDKWRNKPIHLACKKDHIDIVKILIENKCDINASDKSGKTPIHLACENGHIDIVKILIENKCDINASNHNGYQPIHLACRNGHVDIVKILIENKCDINVSNQSGNTPIHLACENGHIDIVKILIENNCDINVYDNWGNKPIHIARRREYQKIFDIMLSYDAIESIVTSLNLHCTINCDHKFCRETLNKDKLQKGESIGSGSFGEICKYKISNTNQEIVIKKIKIFYEDKTNIERNINKFSSQIIHRNIVRYFGALEKSGKLCIFMEYISGGSLKNLIDKLRMIEINEVIQYSNQILVGLQFLHSKSIIHRDIKPGNILLDYDKTLKLADFGMSKSLSESFDKADTFCGSPNYLAPEVFSSEPYDYPSDIWSTGATIIHMITGKMPYHNLRPEAVMFRIASTKKIEFTSPQPISDTMQSFINDLLTPDQLERPNANVLLNHSIFDILR